MWYSFPIFGFSLHSPSLSVPGWTFLPSCVALIFTWAPLISFHCYFSNSPSHWNSHPPQMLQSDFCTYTWIASVLLEKITLLSHAGVSCNCPSVESIELFINPLLCPWSATFLIFFSDYSKSSNQTSNSTYKLLHSASYVFEKSKAIRYWQPTSQLPV